MFKKCFFPPVPWVVVLSFCDLFSFSPNQHALFRVHVLTLLHEVMSLLRATETESMQAPQVAGAKIMALS